MRSPGEIENRWSLIVRSGTLSGRRIPLVDEIVLGRGSECTISVADTKMSRQHARIRPRGAKFLIEDLHSNNGTFVNGKRVKRATLRPGDRIAMGRTELEVVIEAVEVPDGEVVGDLGVENRPLTLLDSVPGELARLPTQDFMAALGQSATATQPMPDDVAAFKSQLLETRNFAIVYNLAKSLQEAIAVPELLQVAVEVIFAAIDADRCYILLVDPDSGELVPRFARHRDPRAGPVPLELSRTIIERVLDERSAVVSTDASGDPRFDEGRSVIDLGIRSLLCVPILHGSQVTGIIQLDRISRGGIFIRQDFELMTVIASLLGSRLENVRLFEEQSRTIRALRDAQDELVRKERMALLGRLTSGLAHEISNLMAPFSMAALLPYSHPDDGELIELSELMIEAHRRITTLLHEVRLVARGERPELRVGEHDLSETVRSVVQFARYDGEVKRHRIEVEDAEIPPFLYDEGAIKQVLLNLLRNAAEALAEPDLIVVRLGVEPGNTPVARVDVIDTGPGIPTELLEKIWEPFFTTKEDQGVGLGLYVSHSIVERHDGRIECKSELGHGTAFSIRLPVRQL